MKTNSEPDEGCRNVRVATLPFMRASRFLAACHLIAASLISPALAQSVFIPEGDPQRSLDDFLGNAWSIAVDADGHIFVADPINQVVRKYLPDGSPAAVIGQMNRSGRADGTAAQARFSSPFSLCYDGADGILVLDNSTFVRRIDTATLVASTLANLSSGVDGTHMYDITLGTFQNSGSLSNLRLGDVAARGPGVYYVSASDNAGVIQYLLRCAGPNARAIATSRTPVASSSLAGTRGVAIDPFGNVFMPFPVLSDSGLTAEHIFRFPGGEAASATRHYGPVIKLNNMSAGRGDRLYCFTSMNPAIEVIASTTPNTLLATLTVTPTFPSFPRQETKDAAVTLNGDLLAANLRVYDGAGSLCSPYGKVDRFDGVDTAVGADAGDTVPPAVQLTLPVNGTALDSPAMLEASASDNSGAVQVQFRVNDRDFGAPVTTSPFRVLLDPASLPAGNLILYAIARDAAGCSTTSVRIQALNRVGWPNFEGEVFAGDAMLNNPVGVAVDGAGGVCVGDGTRLLRFTPLGELSETYGSTNAMVVDGDATTVRFGNLRGLGTDSAGRIVAMDDRESGGCFLRQFDPATCLTTTLCQIDAQTNAFQLSDAYAIPAGAMAPNGGPGPLWGWMDGRDVEGLPGSGLVTTLGNLIGWDFFEPIYPYHFLVRWKNGANALLAYSADSWFPDDNPRAVAVAADGTVFASFQTDVIFKQDSLYALAPQFPVGGTNAVRRLFSSMDEVDHLAVDAASRVYVPCRLTASAPAHVSVVSSVQAGAVLFALQQRLLNQPQDIAIDAQGNVYVIATESVYYDGRFRLMAQVVRYARAACAFPETAGPPDLVPGLCRNAPGGGTRLVFTATPGGTYEIQMADALPGIFRTIGAVKAVGASAAWFDTGFSSGSDPALAMQRFYRVRRVGTDSLPP